MIGNSGPESGTDRGATVARGTGLSPSSVLMMAIWFGLVAGLLELLLLVVRVTLLEKGFFLRSAHFIWMVPASELAIFGAWGLSLAIVARWSRRLPTRWAVGSFVFLACVSQLLLVRGLNSLTCGLLAAGIAFRSAPWIAARLPRFGRLIRHGTPALIAILALLVGWAVAREALGRSRPVAARAAPGDQAPNILLIVLDTVRADHLRLYGYDRDTTPNLARLASQGVRFDRAHSSAPWTLPSQASLMTGRWPHELSVGRLGWLDATYPTLAEFLRGHGYATAGFVANQFFCGHESGLARGFDTYCDFPVTPAEVLRASSLGWFLAQKACRLRDELRFLAADDSSSIGLDFSRKDAATINREFLNWLSASRHRPFFAFLNYFDAHDPYLTPEGVVRPFEKGSRSRQDVLMLRDWQKLNKQALDPSQISLARDAYDDCIASLDRELGRLFDELRRRDLFDETMLILTADHGEQFGEHGGFGHGLSLYESEIHVPLLVVFPGRVPRGLVVHEDVSLRDVPATVVDMLGWRGDSPFPGESLAGAWEEQRAGDRNALSPSFSELDPSAAEVADPLQTDASHGPISAILDEGKVYIRHGNGSEELYDLDVDPTESHNLSGTEGARPILARCRRIFDQINSGAMTTDQPSTAAERRVVAQPHDGISALEGAAHH
jgi:arylsulfatase A-like enzyme